MGRNFSNGERNRLINDMQRISLNYQTIINQQKSLYKDVKTDLQLLTLKGIADKLDAMSVDILADFKMGFRTKTLKDYNFNTYKDIYLTSVDELEKIRGISLDKAVQIKKIVLDVANEFKKEVKINLSIDNIDGSRFNLINSLYRYNTYSKYVDELLKVVNYRDTNEKIRFFAHNSGFFNYTFKAHEIKEKVNDTYSFLTSFRNKEGIAINNTFKAVQGFKTTRKEALADFEAHPISYINQLEALDPNLFGKDDKKFGLDEDLYNDVNSQVILEDGLKCTLRSYQTLGVKYILSQRRVLLGDEMGLGKTIEAIAAMVSLRNSGMDHFIVVCPASVLINWQREINKHSDLKTLVVHGEDATANLNKWDIEGGVAITTYEATKYFQALNENTRVDMLIVDEAHYIKNPDALRTKNCIELAKLSNYILFMTGTALENKVEEMCNLIKILNPEVAKTLNSLVIMNATLFKSKIATVYYRRKREDVLTELPDLIESDE